jgi:hypothetical protein
MSPLGNSGSSASLNFDMTIRSSLKQASSNDSRLKAKPESAMIDLPLKKRHRVSFSEDFEMIEAPLPETLKPKEGRFTFEDQLEALKHRGRTAACRHEDRARANLNRLAVNHRRVVRRCSCGNVVPVCDCCTALSSAVCVCASRMAHATISGDVMLLGHQPGIPEDVVLLAGAIVSVDGVTVSISNEGMPTIVQTLENKAQAKKWASKVRVAAELWEDSQTLAEAALKKNGFHQNGDIEGIDTAIVKSKRCDVFPKALLNSDPANDLQSAQLETSDLKDQVEALLERVSAAAAWAEKAAQIGPSKVRKAYNAEKLWIRANSTIRFPPSKTMLPATNGENSLWSSVARWMPSLFQGAPAVLV